MRLPTKQTLHRGFTLVEVALALAVASMAIMSVMGLLPMLLDFERKNTATSLLPTLCSQVMGKLREEPYATTLPTGSRFLYFTDQGTFTANAQDAVYACEITHKALPVEAIRPGGAHPPTPGNHCQMVHMKFHWPVGTLGGEVRIFQATLAND